MYHVMAIVEGYRDEGGRWKVDSGCLVLGQILGFLDPGTTSLGSFEIRTQGSALASRDKYESESWI